jgi:hypothetical protein
VAEEHVVDGTLSGGTERHGILVAPLADVVHPAIDLDHPARGDLPDEVGLRILKRRSLQ